MCQGNTERVLTRVSRIRDTTACYKATQMDNQTQPVSELEQSEVNETTQGLLEAIDAMK